MSGECSKCGEHALDCLCDEEYKLVKWINVKHTLPTNGQRILCYGNPTICCEEDMKEKQICLSYFENKRFSWKEDDKGNAYDEEFDQVWEIDQNYHVLNVDWWMPLPQSPPESSKKHNEVKEHYDD